MITDGQKTSLLISSQLPEFIRDNPDYDKFVVFLQAYYEWMEENGNVTERSKNILSYKDIDRTSSEFLQYYINDFLPYFPKDSLIDEQTAIKIAKQLYSSKGTPASYKFLFKVLFGSDFDYFYTKDSVLRASDAQWYVAKSLRLATTDPRFLSIQNYRLFGETSKSIATVENTVLTGSKTEVFISNIERLFESGEFIRVVDNNNQDVLINGQTLRAKVVGQLSSIKISPKYRGLFYKPGDPVIVSGGLNSNTGIGAIAEVGTVTKGSIQNIVTLTGGLGYTPDPTTTIEITNAPGAVAVVSSLVPDANTVANVSFIPTQTIDPRKYITLGASNYVFPNYPNANANTKLSDAFSFTSFSTYPISTLLVLNGGGGISSLPQVTAVSRYVSETDYGNLKSLGILGPIQIGNGGLGYQNNDTILITGGSGYGAYANVVSVSSANGKILKVGFKAQGNYPVGGMGYRADALPTLSVSSANVNASGAVLYVTGILGDGATFSPVTDRAGSISTINILDPGEDYSGTPNVSLKVQDIVVSNVSITDLPQKGEIAYQGTSISLATYLAKVNNVVEITYDNDPSKSLFVLRVYDYTSTPDTNKTLKFSSSKQVFKLANTAYDSTFNERGIRNYGDGKARANASFLNGLVISQGQYLNEQGQPSSFSVLQSKDYNNFTYQINVEKEISKYRDILLNLLHPTGTKIIGRYVGKANASFNMFGVEGFATGYPLSHYTGYLASSATMVTDFTNKSNNIVTFNNLAGANIASFIFTGSRGSNTIIEIKPTNGPNVYSEVISINAAANTITLKDNVWLTFANVANVSVQTGTNTINILSLTGAYDFVNGGLYSNTSNYLRDIVFVGDTIKLANNATLTVQSINYDTKVIRTTTNIANNVTSPLMSVQRPINTTQVRLFGLVGTQYIPELITENNQTITTENGQIILIS